MEGLQRFVPPFQRLKEWWVGDSEQIAIQLTYLAGEENRWRLTVDCHKLNQVVTPIVAAAPDVDSLCEQINTSFCT